MDVVLQFIGLPLLATLPGWAILAALFLAPSIHAAMGLRRPAGTTGG